MRSAVKSITYRLMHMLVDLAVAYYFTREVAFSLGIVALVNIYSICLYYVHERLWGKIRYGLTKE